MRKVRAASLVERFGCRRPAEIAESETVAHRSCHRCDAGADAILVFGLHSAKLEPSLQLAPGHSSWVSDISQSARVIPRIQEISRSPAKAKREKDYLDAESKGSDSNVHQMTASAQ